MAVYLENKSGVHLMNGQYTLCGEHFGGGNTVHKGATNRESPSKTKKRTVTCTGCKEVIILCRGVRISTPPSSVIGTMNVYH